MLSEDEEDFALSVVVNHGFCISDGMSYTSFSVTKKPDITKYSGRSLNSYFFNLGFEFARYKFSATTSKKIAKCEYEIFFSTNKPDGAILSESVRNFFERYNIRYQPTKAEIAEIGREERVRTFHRKQKFEALSYLSLAALVAFAVTVVLYRILGSQSDAEITQDKNNIIRYQACSEAGSFGKEIECEKALKKAGLN